MERSLYENSGDTLDLEWTRQRKSDAKFTDEEYFQTLLVVTFASGFNAATAMRFNDNLREFMPDIATAAKMTSADIDRMIASRRVIRHKRKLQACVNNARALQAIAEEHGSLQNFIDERRGTESFEDLLLLNEALRAKFDYISHITVYHFMTDAGLPVLKPDRAIVRLYKRLGLIDNEQLELHAIREGRKFADATGHTMRYIDAVFVNYGQLSMWNGKPGICVNKPKCKLCGARHFCPSSTVKD